MGAIVLHQNYERTLTLIRVIRVLAYITPLIYVKPQVKLTLIEVTSIHYDHALQRLWH